MHGTRLHVLCTTWSSVRWSCFDWWPQWRHWCRSLMIASVVSLLQFCRSSDTVTATIQEPITIVNAVELMVWSTILITRLFNWHFYWSTYQWVCLFGWLLGRLILWTVSHALLCCVNSESSFTVYEAKIVESEMSRGLGKDCIYLNLSQKYILFFLCVFVQFCICK